MIVTALVVVGVLWLRGRDNVRHLRWGDLRAPARPVRALGIGWAWIIHFCQDVLIFTVTMAVIL